MAGPCTSKWTFFLSGLQYEESVDRWKMRKTKNNKIIKFSCFYYKSFFFWTISRYYCIIPFWHSFFPPIFSSSFRFYSSTVLLLFYCTLLCSLHLSLLIWFLLSFILLLFHCFGLFLFFSFALPLSHFIFHLSILVPPHRSTRCPVHCNWSGLIIFCQPDFQVQTRFAELRRGNIQPSVSREACRDSN